MGISRWLQSRFLRTVCGFCGRPTTGLNNFVCPYCKCIHCAEHRLPASHACGGKPKSPQRSFREIHRHDWRVEAHGK